LIHSCFDQFIHFSDEQVAHNPDFYVELRERKKTDKLKTTEKRTFAEKDRLKAVKDAYLRQKDVKRFASAAVVPQVITKLP